MVRPPPPGGDQYGRTLPLRMDPTRAGRHGPRRDPANAAEEACQLEHWVKLNRIQGMATRLRLCWIYGLVQEIICVVTISLAALFGHMRRDVRTLIMYTRWRLVCKSRNGHLVLAPGHARVGDTSGRIRSASS
ncbi:hypothetical protein BKA56DRAFT_611137 [Ilyonectria sp. MPI-CAGE-AT-0026]|nr:hypothetical protein BKA56DRAFT_611137 [Ilyonectria sp. MPI-CAGE-AT-0026]